MSAIDELRKMLDERGVGHFDGVECTLWGYEPTGECAVTYRYAADEVGHDRMTVRLFHVTPAQAIAATLGDIDAGTCHEIEDEDTGFIVCSECGAVHDTDYTSYYCWCCGRKVVTS